MSAIEAVHLHRDFRLRTGLLRREVQQVHAVRDLTLQVDRGELYGLLGPNGAGKTTTIKMLITLLLPTSGTARVLGLDVVDDPRAIRRRIGYVFGGDRGLYQRLSAFDNLRYFAELYAVPARRQAARIGQLLELVGLEGRERDRVETFSRGMRQRLHIARGLLHDPELLFLDEPTIGIDPVGARELRATIGALKAAGKTILLTTHYMFEADDLCDRLAVITGGRIVAEGTPTDLKARMDTTEVLEIETDGAPDEAVQRVRATPGVRSVTTENLEHRQQLVVDIKPGANTIPAVIGALGDVRIRAVRTREATLEDAYIHLVSRS